jgi:catechol 2,3-dioxygenase-like lactoylglutathione lyase family enzyme
MKLREGEPWMTGSEYSKTLSGLTINLLVQDIDEVLGFQTKVLGAEVVYSDPDFAVMSGYGTEWMLHADHTYDKHPMGGTVESGSLRGAGAELRLHGRDPDAAETAAREMELEVLSPATDKGHGLREAYIRDADGYVWVPDVRIDDSA